MVYNNVLLKLFLKMSLVIKEYAVIYLCFSCVYFYEIYDMLKEKINNTYFKKSHYFKPSKKFNKKY